MHATRGLTTSTRRSRYVIYHLLAYHIPGGKQMWPDNVDEILGSDQVVALAYTTPANGVILTPLTNFGLRDREAGTLSPVNSSVAAWRKLDRIRKSPKVALAYHTRTPGFSDRRH